MIAEVVGLVAIVGGITTLALVAISAERRAGKENARATELAVRLEVAIANGKNESNRADDEKERADDLDAAIAELAARAVGPVDGSLLRLLEARARTRAPRRDRAPVVRDAGPASGETAAVGPDDLLPPGA